MESIEWLFPVSLLGGGLGLFGGLRMLYMKFFESRSLNKSKYIPAAEIIIIERGSDTLTLKNLEPQEIDAVLERIAELRANRECHES